MACVLFAWGAALFVTSLDPRENLPRGKRIACTITHTALS